MENYKTLKKLVELNTIKDKENFEILEYIEKTLIENGFKTEYKNKNLIMSIGQNPKFGFLGHTDTVEIIEGWKTNPHELNRKNGKLFGLGVCDMKGGIAAIIDAVKAIDLSKIKNGIKLYFTYDEEIGFSGVYDLISNKEKFPEVMIFGEPTANEILVGSKGLLEIDLYFKGIKAHSSNPKKGKSANMNAMKYLLELEKFYNENIRKDYNEKYEVPYTTMNVGLINGGSAKNSVSASCYASIDFRIIVDEHIKLIKDKLKELAKKYDCEVKVIEEIKPFYNEVEFTEEIKTANFMTEASFVTGCKKMILGTGPVTAHEVNEYITEESYNLLVKQYKEIIEKICM